MMHGGTHFEAERVVRGIELKFAETFHKEALHALDAADGQHLKETAGYRKQIEVMTQIMETIPKKHMRFGIVHEDGSYEKTDVCADWCYAYKTDRLSRRVEELEKQLGIG
jgi:hypothetical protein